MEVIGDYYAELRSQADTNALPITVRTLETIIRLSTAAAKSPPIHRHAPLLLQLHMLSVSCMTMRSMMLDVRTLETIIWLSTAAAKSRLSTGMLPTCYHCTCFW